MSNKMQLDETFLPVGAMGPQAADDAVRVGAFEPRSLVAGPGERAVLWVTGCLRRCPACMKPEWFAFDTGLLNSISAIAERVLAIHAARPLQGITFSGGEPFEQATPLAALAAELRWATGLDVLAYSGYRLDALRSTPRFAPLLDQCDWIIDGEYRQDRSGPLRWRGSANQTLYHRGIDGTHVSVCPADEAPGVREVQVSLTAHGVRLSGFPNSKLHRGLQARLRQRGITMIPLKS